jgi:predicted HAD superfamily Cof-like phosphohydrolase
LFDIENYRSVTDARNSPVSERPDLSQRGHVQLRLVVGPQDLVEEFHLAFGLPVGSKPSAEVPESLAELRKLLLDEEVGELAYAIDEGDLAAIARELADVIYVAYGTAVTYGIDLDAVVVEIHRSNMSKLDDNGNPIVREDGKVLKGPNYKSPNIAAALGAPPKPGHPHGAGSSHR